MVGRERFRGPEMRVDVFTESWLRSQGKVGAGHDVSKSFICARTS